MTTVATRTGVRHGAATDRAVLAMLLVHSVRSCETQ